MDKHKLFSEIVRLKDDSISLHSVEEKDGEQLFKIYSNKDIFTYCGILNKKNKETVIKMIPHFKRDFSKGSRIKWGIFQATDDLLIGIIEVMNVNLNIDSLSIGFNDHRTVRNCFREYLSSGRVYTIPNHTAKPIGQFR